MGCWRYSSGNFILFYLNSWRKLTKKKKKKIIIRKRSEKINTFCNHIFFLRLECSTNRMKVSHEILFFDWWCDLSVFFIISIFSVLSCSSSIWRMDSFHSCVHSLHSMRIVIINWNDDNRVFDHLQNRR